MTNANDPLRRKALRDWDEELLESLDKVVEAFSSEDNLDAALDRTTTESLVMLLFCPYFKVGKQHEDVLMTGDVFGVVPSEVNAVFDYTEYTRFGLWTSETIPSGPRGGHPRDGGSG